MRFCNIRSVALTAFTTIGISAFAPQANAASLETVKFYISGCINEFENLYPGMKEKLKSTSDADLLSMGSSFDALEAINDVADLEIMTQLATITTDPETGAPSSAEQMASLKTSACIAKMRLVKIRNGNSNPATSNDLFITATAATNSMNGSLNQAQIDACSNDIKAMQVQSQSWPGDVNDVAARLGQYQKDMFEGRCAGHPEAQAYITSANRMLGNGSGTGATKNGKRSNVSDANATHCLAPQKEGGVINNCAYAVEYNYCVVQPTPGSWAASFDCSQGKSGSWQVGPNSRAIMQTAGSQVAFFACKYGPTLSNPDGISPADFRYNANGLPSGRCREWGAP